MAAFTSRKRKPVVVAEEEEKKKKSEAKTSRETRAKVTTAETRHFPYPYSGVYFAYTVPDPESFLREQKGYADAVAYLLDVKKVLPPDAKGAFVYPLPGNARHENFLQWVKVIQYVRQVPESVSRESLDFVEKSPFVNFYPGNPHMQWRWLMSLDRGSPELEPIMQTEDVVYTKNPRLEDLYPIDDAGNFLVLQYLQPSEIKEIKEIKEKTGDYAYCGDIQLSWELAAKKSQLGNFERCKRQYERQRNLLRKYNLTPQRLPLETLEDIVELMTTKPVAIETLRREAEALDWLMASRKSEIKQIEAEVRERQESKLPVSEREAVDRQLATDNRISRRKSKHSTYQ